MTKEIEAVKITSLQIYLKDGKVINLDEEMIKSLNDVIICQSINQIARSLVRVCENKNKNIFKEIFVNHINSLLRNYLLSNYEPRIPGLKWGNIMYSVLLPTQVDGNFQLTQTNEKATSNIVKVIISVKPSILEGAVIKEAVIQGRRLKFLYYLGQFISYQYNVEYGDCLIVKDLNNGFNEIEITRFLNEKFRREDIAETVRERFMNEIHKLNVQLYDELGVTVEFHRTVPVSVVEKRRSIKTFEIKDIEK